ncbi:MAG: helix-turn-helix domain-containing protein [Lachnospiraceae bacterium]|nr:helix-turn-helix domain-containing protein [Lachnospiraceae bacterium]
MNNIVYQIGLADDVTGFLLSEYPERSTELKEKLYEYTTASQFYDMMLYLYHEDSYMYNHRTSVEVDFFLQRACVFQETDRQIFKEALYSEEKNLQVFPEQEVIGGWIQTYLDNAQVTVFIQTIAPSYDETLVFLVPGTYYDTLLEDEADNLRTDYIIYDGQVIVQRGSVTVADEDLLVALTQEASLSGFSGEVKIDGVNYYLTVEEGDSGLVYCSLQSLQFFRAKVVSGQWGIIFLLIVCIFPAMILILVFSRYVASSVRNLNRMLNPEESSYNFEDIESGIQMLVETNVRQEQQNLEARKSQFASEFFRGSFANEEKVKRAAAEAEIKTGSLYLAALVWGDSETEDDLSFGKYILTAIRQSASVDGYGIRLVGHGQSLFVLFSDSQERIENILGEIFRIGKESADDFCMAVSAYHTDLTEGPAAYLEADTAYGNVFLRGQTQILRFDELNQTESSDVLPDYYLQNLKMALKNRDKDAVTRAVDDICRRMTKENISLFTFRLIYSEILHVLFTEWKGQDAASVELYNVFTLSQCMSIQDFNDLLSDACRVIIEGSSQKDEQGSGDDTDMVDGAIRYMQENYASPELTMAALAEQLHISSVTLSVMFKNSVGVRPSDYLMSLRMEKARELLSTTHMRIKEVGLAVGYEDDHVFTRRFKSYTGRTPGQYREKHK